MKVLLILLILYTIASSAFGLRFFHNGRFRGEKLGVQNDHGMTDDKKNFTRWFTNQNLDHFDVANKATWRQRYFVNDEFLDKSKRDVAFIKIGGEGGVGELWMTNGDWIEKAKKHKAILFQLEHRFYGKSHPTKDLSVDNLRYLNTDQALADIAKFVEAMKKEYKLSPSVKWIAVGGAHGGALAAWSRLKYPRLIHGAVSSSAPLKSVVDFQDYYGVVADDLRDISKNCLEAVQKATAQMDTLLGETSGQKTLTKMFQLCSPLSESANNKNDITNFYDAVIYPLADVAQYNKNNPLAPGDLPDTITLDTICNIMTDSKLGNEIARLAKFNDVTLKEYDDPCLDNNKYNKMIERMRNTSLDAPTARGERQWAYQTCSQFGFIQSSNKKPQVFGNKFPTKFYIQQCMDVFGPKFNETYINSAVRRTNALYGGLDIKVTNVVFVHGSVDPWHPVGITKTRNKESPAIFIKGTAHCSDMFPQAESDPPQLKAAREEIGKHIQTWLHS